ncbi:uncharacterized protein [Rutidosis leptorrhynchoides]|uniref:uncharacterized protein n=1 Tax=Rutidosis leptorrhynchoides TaxID=125765 RepID=UPI003A990C2F
MTSSMMISDLFFQAAFILIVIFMFLWMLNIPQNLYDKFQFRDRSSYAARRHFVLGADLLSKSRSATDHAAAVKLAISAAEEADKSIAINPNDAVFHFLKALALDAQGFTTSALDALDVALSPLTSKSLCGEERSSALFKRAEIKIKIKVSEARGGLESAVSDLEESVRLNGGNAAALRLLGECYERKEMKGEAMKAYMGAIKLEPHNAVARAALVRLGSTA